MRARLLPVLALLAACGGDSNAPEQTMTGTWRGTVSSATMTLSLSQSGRDVTGNGTLIGASTVALTVSGTATLPAFSMTLASGGFQSINFAGQMGTKTLTGTLNGSGFTNDAVTFTKQ